MRVSGEPYFYYFFYERFLHKESIKSTESIKTIESKKAAFAHIFQAPKNIKSNFYS